jgi:hypothetical protein
MLKKVFSSIYSFFFPAQTAIQIRPEKQKEWDDRIDSANPKEVVLARNWMTLMETSIKQGRPVKETCVSTFCEALKTVVDVTYGRESGRKRRRLPMNVGPRSTFIMVSACWVYGEELPASYELFQELMENSESWSQFKQYLDS